MAANLAWARATFLVEESMEASAIQPGRSDRLRDVRLAGDVFELGDELVFCTRWPLAGAVEDVRGRTRMCHSLSVLDVEVVPPIVGLFKVCIGTVFSYATRYVRRARINIPQSLSHTGPTRTTTLHSVCRSLNKSLRQREYRSRNGEAVDGGAGRGVEARARGAGQHVCAADVRVGRIVRAQPREVVKDSRQKSRGKGPPPVKTSSLSLSGQTDGALAGKRFCSIIAGGDLRAHRDVWYKRGEVWLSWLGTDRRGGKIGLSIGLSFFVIDRGNVITYGTRPYLILIRACYYATSPVTNWLVRRRNRVTARLNTGTGEPKDQPTVKLDWFLPNDYGQVLSGDPVIGEDLGVLGRDVTSPN
ncbi:hypothetical protein H4582DRAFT_2055022 [Lactarius indigo]|nr:hypothetical protein H4582DRAFT_2055022 [Lactarius indigo]